MASKYLIKSYIPQRNVYGSDHKVERVFMLNAEKFITAEWTSGFDKSVKRKIIAGQVYPSNDTNAIGIIANDYDVTYPDAIIPVAVCTHGVILQNKMVNPLDNAAKEKMRSRGIDFWNGNIGNNKPVLKCWNVAEFIAGTEKHIMVAVELSNAEFLPLVFWPGRWTITRGVIEEVSIKTWNLVFLWINVKDVTSGSGEIKVNLANKTATTAQSSANPLPDPIVVARYFAATKKNLAHLEWKRKTKGGIKLDGSKIFD